MKTNNFPHFPPRLQQGEALTCQVNALAAICMAICNRAGTPRELPSRMFPLNEGARLQGLPIGSIPAMEFIVRAAQTIGIPPESEYAYMNGTNKQPPTDQQRAIAAQSKLGAVGSIPVDQFNGPATASLVRAALAQGYLVGMAFRRRRWFAELWAPETEHLRIAAAVQPGSSEHMLVDNHYVIVGDVDDNFDGQGLAFVVYDSKGSNGDGSRDVAIIGPQLFKDAISIEVFKGFADCNDRHTYDADGIPGQVFRLYQAAFNRQPDKGGLGYQIDAAKNGLPLWQLAMNFMASPEGQQKLPPTLTNAQYVDRLYDNVLHRPGDAQGLAHHLANLNGGMARHDVLMQFAGSPENKAACAPAFERGVAYT